jgi:tRNA threonylcarbamoyladenosine biosynthesis protein TsaE
MAPDRTPRVFRSRSPEATEELGRRIGEQLGPGCVVGLKGELGAGKTVLVRGIARGLEVEDRVTSPSFTLMHEFEGRVPLYHFDAWMSGREELFLEGGGAEYLGGEGVAVVEWADRVERWMPPLRLELLLQHRSPTERRLTLRLRGGGERRGRVEGQLQAALSVSVAHEELLEERSGGEKCSGEGEPFGRGSVPGTH